MVLWARYNLRANKELCCDALVVSSRRFSSALEQDNLMLAEFHGFNIRPSLSIQKEARWTRELVILENAAARTDGVVRTDGREKNT